MVVQWVKLPAPNSGGPSLIPGQGARSHLPQLKILHATMKIKDPRAAAKTWHSQKKKKDLSEKQRHFVFNSLSGDLSPLKLLLKQCPGFSQQRACLLAKREDRHDSMLNILILSTYLSSLLSSLANFSALESSTQCLGVRSHWDSSRSQTIPSLHASSTTHQLWDLRQALSLLSFGFPVCKTGIVTNYHAGSLW